MRRLKLLISIAIISLIAISALSLNLDKEIYIKRRAQVVEKMNSGIAIIMSSNHILRNGDVYYPFRVNNNFFYLTGIKEPGAILVLSPLSTRNNSYLFLPPSNPSREHVVGKSLGPGKEAQEISGIKATLSIEKFESLLAMFMSRVDTLYYLSSSLNTDFDAPLTPELLFINKLKERFPHLVLKDLTKILNEMRVIKSPQELELMQRAIDITCTAHREAMKSAEPGMYEYEVRAVIEYVYQKKGASGWGFPCIIGSGPNSCIMHYDKCTRKTEAGDLMVIDIGAEYENYSADITRTIPVSGKFTQRQKEIYSIVLEANKRAIAAVKPGLTIRDIDKVARDYITSKGYGKYFIHGTSHYLGMDVHDVGSRDPKFKPGTVITVEPGIYIPEGNLGVRIEDDVLVTENGHKVLSAVAPKEIVEIEKLMKEKGIGNIAIK